MPEVALIEVPSGFVVEVEGNPVLNNKIFTGVYLIPVEIFTDKNSTIHLEGVEVPNPNGFLTNDEEYVFTFLTDEGRIWVLDQDGKPFKVRRLSKKIVEAHFICIFPPPPHLHFRNLIS
jgi:hypothetical protein